MPSPPPPQIHSQTGPRHSLNIAFLHIPGWLVVLKCSGLRLRGRVEEPLAWEAHLFIFPRTEEPRGRTALSVTFWTHLYEAASKNRSESFCQLPKGQRTSRWRQSNCGHFPSSKACVWTSGHPFAHGQVQDPHPFQLITVSTLSPKSHVNIISSKVPNLTIDFSRWDPEYYPSWDSNFLSADT